ncbi:MAG TPA: antitoxin Xre/MbcA/ParS toxin-binding domain-containing protein [Sphingomicrobium sp.]|nr:antitoxin Xre/MbcA/ParS toxin-binding domain-containing protein [Sphingomicrobium sp.]
MNEAAELSEARVLPDEERVLTAAVSRAANLWDLTNANLGRIIGVSAPTASRLRSGQKYLLRGTKPFELGQYFVRLFRSLDALTGSDDQSAISWLSTENKDLGGRPIDLIMTVKGLAEVSNYVDDFRARV